MPHTRRPDEVSDRWLKFVRALRKLTGGVPEHRYQDQFLQVREAAFDLADSSQMASEVATAYSAAATTNQQASYPLADVAEIVVRELEAFPQAVAVHEAEASTGAAKPGGLQRLVSAAKTILGSVADVFKLTDFGKGVVTVLKEACELLE